MTDPQESREWAQALQTMREDLLAPDVASEALVRIIALADENERLLAAVADADEMLEASEERNRWPACACAWDNKDDVCVVHSPAVSRHKAENERLREALEHIDSRGCTKFTGSYRCTDVSSGLMRVAEYTAEAWCGACVARAVLEGENRD